MTAAPSAPTCAKCGHAGELRAQPRFTNGTHGRLLICVNAQACSGRMSSWKAQREATFRGNRRGERPAPLVEPIVCVRCRRTVARAMTKIGEHGFRQCADEHVCSHTRLASRQTEGAA